MADHTAAIEARTDETAEIIRRLVQPVNEIVTFRLTLCDAMGGWGLERFFSGIQKATKI